MDLKAFDIITEDLSAEEVRSLCRKDGLALRGCVSMAGLPGGEIYRDAVFFCLEERFSREGPWAAKDADAASGLGCALFFALRETGEQRRRDQLEQLYNEMKGLFSGADGGAPCEALIRAQPFFAGYDVLFGGRRNAGETAALLKRAHALYGGPGAPGWYLMSLIDTVDAMDEQIYEHYRAVADLFRQAAAPGETLSALAVYALLKGVRLHLLDGDLYQPVLKKAFARLERDHPEGPGAYLLALSEYRRQRWNY